MSNNTIMTSRADVARLGELGGIEGRLLEEQVFRELGWDPELLTEPCTETQIPPDTRDRLAAPVPPRRTRFMQGIGNMAMVGGLLVSSIDMGHVCPSSEVLADKGSFSAQLPGDEDMRFLRVSTFNTYESQLGSSEVIRAINAQHSHIVGLQEVNRLSLAQIEARTDYKSVMEGYAHGGEGGFYGVALLTDLPVISKNTYEISSETDHERRVVLVAKLRYHGEELVVAVTHLVNKEPGFFGDDRDAARLAQAEALVQVLQKPEYRGAKKIVLGDFNADRNNVARLSLEARYTDAGADLGLIEVTTFPWDGSEKDAIYTSRPSGLVPMEMTRWGGEASDHCGITVTYAVEE
jgi:endonuclease/exonuclease/phosphatase family metal-dependent hydrolase